MGVEHPVITTLVLGHAAFDSIDTLSQAAESRHVFRSESDKFARGIYGPWVKRWALPNGVADLFAHRLAHKCGLRVPEVSLSADEPRDFQNYYVRKVVGGWALSRRVPDSLPIYYLKGQTETVAPAIKVEQMFMRKFQWQLDKRCPVGRAVYADFPEKAPEAALEAARWNSTARLRGHAFRAFLGATYGHTSNCLVDTSGKLWLIDHEKIAYRKGGEDIEALFKIVCESELVMDQCRAISVLTREDISTALADIPARFWGKTQADESIEYFCERLDSWQKVFALERTEVAYAS
jgi:hypothetical protein